MQQRRRLTTKRLRPTTAFVSAVAVMASALVGVQATNVLRTDGTAIDPITPSVASSNLSDGENVVVEDAAISAQGGEAGARTVKEFTQEDPFSMVAVTWEGNKDVAVFVRSMLQDGSWSEWYDTDPYDLSDATASLRQGTELIYVEPTTRIQVSMSGVDFYADDATNGATEAVDSVDAPEASTSEPSSMSTKSSISNTDNAASTGAPTPLDYDTIAPVAEVSDPNNYEVVFIDGGESELPANGIDLTSDADGMPRVISRAGWGADESLRCQNPQYFDGGVTGLTVHHTAGSNNYTESQAPGIVRGIYLYHAQTLGWCDVGYQSLVDKYGNIYEGRYGGLNKDVYGAHAGGFNRNTWAVSMMGNYETSPTTTAMIESVGAILGWRAAVAGLDPTGTHTHVSEGTSYSKYSAGTSVSLPNIFAHRDVGLTTCPGNYGYAQMSNIRAIAKNKYDSIVSGQAATTPSTQAAVPEQAAGSSTTATTTSASSSSTATSSSTSTSASSSTNASTTTSADATVATTTAASAANLGDAQSISVASPSISPSANQSTASLETISTLPSTSTVASSSHNAATFSTAPTEAVALINQLLNADSYASATDAVDSLVALGLRAITQANIPGTLATLGEVEIIEGLRLANLPAVAQNLLSRTGSSQIEQVWANIIAQYGEVLGDSRSAKQKYASTVDGKEVAYALFDNGIIVSNETTGTYALWGALGDAWAAQGFEVGPLGLPTSNPVLNNGSYVTQFQNGSITWNPATGAISINIAS